MELEKYINLIDQCPDELLTSELGVYDNWRIPLKADFNKVLTDLETSSKYHLRDIGILDDIRTSLIFKEIPRNSDFTGKNIVCHLDYNPGAVILQLTNFFGYTLKNLFFQKEGVLPIEQEKFNILITLHYDRENEIPGITNARAMAEVIKDISGYIQKENLRFCFPDSIGWNHRKDEDCFSRVVLP
ncbi:MAG TPA: hypothetical protein PLK34_03245 [Candidatus Pacearchaeota archaeon]|nr:hypothetical protein [Candidatus Pacearchaeota archaeon]